MKAKVNAPARSKINWTALGAAIITVLVLKGWIPPEYQDVAITIVGIVLPALIATFRTWFTEPRQ